jgi:hypothetical protein
MYRGEGERRYVSRVFHYKREDHISSCVPPSAALLFYPQTAIDLLYQS